MSAAVDLLTGGAALVLLGIGTLVLAQRGRHALARERALRERAELRARRVEALLETSPDVRFTIGPDEQIGELELPLPRGHAVRSRQLATQRASELFVPSALEPLRQARARAIGTGDPQAVAFSLRLFDELRFYEGHVAVLEGSTVLVQLRDATERLVATAALHEARTAADQATRAREALLTRAGRDGAKHAAGVPELLRARGHALDADTWRELDIMQSAAEHVFALVRDLLDFNGLEQHRLPLRREPTDPVALVSDVVARFEAGATRRGTRLALRVGKGLPERMMLDPQRTREVVTKLVTRAVELTAHGHVLVGVEHEEHVLVLSVSDTAPGIEREALPFAFDAYAPTDTDAAPRATIRALALAVTRKLVEALGGSIAVESTSEGGSTFRVRLPELDASTVRSRSGA